MTSTTGSAPEEREGSDVTRGLSIDQRILLCAGLLLSIFVLLIVITVLCKTAAKKCHNKANPDRHRIIVRSWTSIEHDCASDAKDTVWHTGLLNDRENLSQFASPPPYYKVMGMTEPNKHHQDLLTNRVKADLPVEDCVMNLKNVSEINPQGPLSLLQNPPDLPNYQEAILMK